MTDKTDSVELLPCPFCGGEAHSQTNSSRSKQHSKYVWAEHADNCPMQCSRMHHWQTEAQAIAAWNTRATQSHAEQVAALVEALGLLRQREFQMMGAAISRRNWHELEAAYNAARDRMDRSPICTFALQHKDRRP